MDLRRSGTLLLIVVVATAATTAGVIGIGQTQDTERPVTGQAPDTTPTTTSNADSIGAQETSAEPRTYRVTATNETALNPAVLAQYGEVGTQAGRHIEVTLSPQNLTKIKSLPWVQTVRPVRTPVSQKLNLSSAPFYVQQLQTQSAAGTDAKVGVIDKGFDSSNEYISNNIETVRYFRDDRGDPYHGTAVAEIVARIAPETELYLAGINSGTDTEAAIRYLIDQDVDVIVMSIGYLEDDDGQHFLTDDMVQARQNGVLFVTSAGNQAEKHWEGEFRSTDGDEFHDWVAGDELNCLQNCQSDISGSVTIRLDWEDDSNDASRYQAILVDPITNETIARSEDISQYDSGTAYLVADLTNQPTDLAIKNVAGPADDTIEISVFGPSLQHSTPQSSLLAPADVPESTTVAAYEPGRNRIAPYTVRDQLTPVSRA